MAGSGEVKRRGRGALSRRVSESPLDRLKRLGKLNTHEEAAADQIQLAHAYHTGADASCEMDLGEVRGDLRADSAERAAAHRIDALKRYGRWRADLKRTPALAAAVAVLIEERGIRETERGNHWRNGAAMAHLLAGLRHFAAICGNTPRGVQWRYK